MTYEEFVAKHAAERNAWDQFQKRCADCCYLVAGDDGSWVCDNAQTQIEAAQSSCPLMGKED